MTYSCVKMHDARRTVLLADWEKWLKSADKLYLRMYQRLEGESPFDYNEMSCVGLLCSAAGIAGHLPMLEYNIVKAASHDRRFRVGGRADLWFEGNRDCYSFEMKRIDRGFSYASLSRRLQKANADIRLIQANECHVASGCLLAVASDKGSMKICNDFAASDEVDLAYKIGPKDEPAFLFFKVRE